MQTGPVEAISSHAMACGGGSMAEEPHGSGFMATAEGGSERAPSALGCLCSGPLESERAGTGVVGEVEHGEMPRQAGATGRGQSPRGN